MTTSFNPIPFSGSPLSFPECTKKTTVTEDQESEASNLAGALHDESGYQGTPLRDLPDNLLQTIGSMLKPEVGQSIDEELQQVNKSLYSSQEREYEKLLGELAKIDVSFLNEENNPLNSLCPSLTLSDIYHRAWRLLSELVGVDEKPLLVQDLVHLLLSLPQHKGWDADPEAFFKEAVDVKPYPLFVALEKQEAEATLRLIIQSLPRKKAIALGQQIFSFTVDEMTIFIDAAYHYAHTPLWSAVAAGKEGLVKRLMEMDADVNARDANGISAICYAAHQGYAKIVKLLLDSPKADPNLPDATDCTALYWACFQGKEEVITILLADKRTEPNAYSATYGFGALHILLSQGFPEIAHLLLKKKELDLTLKDCLGRTGRDWARIRGYTDIEAQLTALETR